MNYLVGEGAELPARGPNPLDVPKKVTIENPELAVILKASLGAWEFQSPERKKGEEPPSRSLFLPATGSLLDEAVRDALEEHVANEYGGRLIYKEVFDAWVVAIPEKRFGEFASMMNVRASLPAPPEGTLQTIRSEVSARGPERIAAEQILYDSAERRWDPGVFVLELPGILSKNEIAALRECAAKFGVAMGISTNDSPDRRRNLEFRAAANSLFESDRPAMNERLGTTEICLKAGDFTDWLIDLKRLTGKKFERLSTLTAVREMAQQLLKNPENWEIDAPEGDDLGLSEVAAALEEGGFRAFTDQYERIGFEAPIPEGFLARFDRRERGATAIHIAAADLLYKLGAREVKDLAVARGGNFEINLDLPLTKQNFKGPLVPRLVELIRRDEAE